MIGIVYFKRNHLYGYNFVGAHVCLEPSDSTVGPVILYHHLQIIINSIPIIIPKHIIQILSTRNNRKHKTCEENTYYKIILC